MNQTQARLNPIRRGSGEHRHSFAQLLFGLGGTVHCEMAAGAFEVSTDHIGIVPTDAEHFFAGRTDDSRLLVVDLFPDDAAVRQIQELEPRAGLLQMLQSPRSLPMPGELRVLIGCAAAQLAQGPDADRLVAHQWATMLAVQVYRLAAGHAELPRDDKRARFEALVDARLDTPPSNAELQRHLGMSGSALHQWCRTCYHAAPQQAVLARRLHWARQRLLNTNVAIARIAHETGFADAPSFTKAFARVHGVTPGALRRGVGDPFDENAAPAISYTA